MQTKMFMWRWQHTFQDAVKKTARKHFRSFRTADPR